MRFLIIKSPPAAGYFLLPPFH